MVSKPFASSNAIFSATLASPVETSSNSDCVGVILNFILSLTKSGNGNASTIPFIASLILLPILVKKFVIGLNMLLTKPNILSGNPVIKSFTLLKLSLKKSLIELNISAKNVNAPLTASVIVVFTVSYVSTKNCTILFFNEINQLPILVITSVT